MIPIIILIFIILIISSAIIAIIASIFSVEVGANNNSGGIESVDYSNVVTTTADGRISYARLNISDEDKQNLYNITSAERGDGTQVQQEYVTSVILNRVLSSHYPNTIMEVISAPSQFSPYSDGSFYTQTISQTTKDAVENVLANGDLPVTSRSIESSSRAIDACSAKNCSVNDSDKANFFLSLDLRSDSTTDLIIPASTDISKFIENCSFLGR